MKTSIWLERLNRLRREFVDPKIAEHRRHLLGRARGAETPGDGMLVEFGST